MTLNSLKQEELIYILKNALRDSLEERLFQKEDIKLEKGLIEKILNQDIDLTNKDLDELFTILGLNLINFISDANRHARDLNKEDIQVKLFEYTDNIMYIWDKLNKKDNIFEIINEKVKNKEKSIFLEELFFKNYIIVKNNKEEINFKIFNENNELYEKTRKKYENKLEVFLNKTVDVKEKNKYYDLLSIDTFKEKNFLLHKIVEKHTEKEINKQTLILLLTDLMKKGYLLEMNYKKEEIKREVVICVNNLIKEKINKEEYLENLLKISFEGHNYNKKLILVDMFKENIIKNENKEYNDILLKVMLNSSENKSLLLNSNSGKKFLYVINNIELLKSIFEIYDKLSENNKENVSKIMRSFSKYIDNFSESNDPSLIMYKNQILNEQINFKLLISQLENKNNLKIESVNKIRKI